MSCQLGELHHDPPINKPVLATITHLKPDFCPILEAGVITPEILYLWRCACQKYLKNCKERTADDLVSFVADEMCEPILEKWYMASQTHTDALKLDAYITELGSLVSERGWEGKMCRKVLGAKMAIGQKFADWAYDIQNVNAILSQAAPVFAIADPELKNILDAGLTETLQADLDTEPVLSTELNAWISEVKGRDDHLKFETGRMQELIDAQPAKSSPKGKPSLADGLSSPKPSLALRLTAPPPKDTILKMKKVLLDLHDGCRRCRKFYIGHRTLNCDGDFPDAATYRTLTQADAIAQAAALRTSKNIRDADYEESDSDRDGEFVKLKVSSADGNWTSGVVRAKVNVGLCIPLILGMPFLSGEHIIRSACRTAVDKRTGFDLLNNPTHPPRQWAPEWTVPVPDSKEAKAEACVI
ncbi:hypothetical protein DFH09DRAFT_1214781 [Mycena vulgaris]|nr:hypothetical protein DFH09DRAFT_1214781 [Mycena vulgaris]